MPKSEKRIHHRHDRSGRLLFSHARTIRDLLEGFIREPWVAEPARSGESCS